MFFPAFFQRLAIAGRRPWQFGPAYQRLKQAWPCHQNVRFVDSFRVESYRDLSLPVVFVRLADQLSAPA